MTERTVGRPLSRREALLGLGALALACESNSSVEASVGDTSGSAEPAETASGDTGPVAPAVSTTADTPELPAITPNRHHYVTSCCGDPEVDGSTWTLELRDFVACGADCEAPKAILATLTLPFLEGLETQDREHTLECIGTGPSGQKIGNAVWSGRTLLDVFAAAGVTVPAGATTLRIRAVDGFSTGLPISDLEKPLWLVWRMNGDPLPTRHGYPARMLVPHRYGMKNPKWMSSIDFLDTPYVGYWESQGWSDPAEYRVHTYIRYPSNKAVVPTGVVRVTGVAYAGSDPVTEVEVTTDYGATWVPATLDYAPGADRWVVWHYDWTLETAGKRSIQARCRTASGAMSHASTNPPPDLGGYGGSHLITLTIGEEAAA